MKTPICPLIKKKCMEHECMFYTHVTMTNPQTGQEIDENVCSITLIPMLAIEGARCTRGVQASVESMRNEVVKRQDQLNAAVQIGVSHERAVGYDVDVPSIGSNGTHNGY